MHLQPARQIVGLRVVIDVEGTVGVVGGQRSIPRGEPRGRVPADLSLAPTHAGAGEHLHRPKVSGAELVTGRTATDVAALPKEELLEEIGIPLTPIRLKCAILGLGVLKVALHKAKGTPLPAEWQNLGDDLQFD